ncbi:MAG: S8 family serine peptidase [Bacteriovoracaceae bacterium]
MKYFIFLILIYSSFASASRYIVEARNVLDPKIVKQFKLVPFAQKKHSYFSKVYSISGNYTADKLRKLNWVKRVEEGHELSKLNLTPAEKSQRLVADELFVYQWGLFNQGQTLFREKDDIHNIPMKGIQNKDIGWGRLLKELPTKRPVVAVLDSGVDINHPELQGNLWTNVNECGKDPNIDNDNNKLKGDCRGWNFTEEIDSEDAKDPSDNDGHGTHIAGIIAAKNDNRGTVGVLPNALIMPIKVMKDSDSKSEVASSESFARGIIYAVENGAQVINMSLGWPRSLETKYLREAVYYALNNGVMIVAAAGNNNSSEPLFPCAYEGVICVGATTLDGTVASFSNYGGHVDTLAPGEGILSLNPLAYEPELFAVPGYEIRSGTSQSSPFVAALVAALKANTPELSIDDVFAKLYQFGESVDSEKFFLGGVAIWEKLNQKISTPVVRPVLKRIRQILVKGLNPEARLTIPVRNYGTTAENVQVSVESLSAGLQFVNDTQLIDKLNKSEARDLNFNLKVLDFNSESTVKIKVNIRQGSEVQSFINEIPVVRDIRQDSNFKALPFIFSSNPNPLGTIRNNDIISYLSTMDSYNSPGHDLFMKRVITEGENKKLEVRIFSRKGNQFQEKSETLFINNVVDEMNNKKVNPLVNIIRVDLNFDKSPDYLVQTLIKKDKKIIIQFSFYNYEMKPLWPKFQDVQVINDTFILDMNTLSFVKYNHPELGKILVPAFFTKGVVPKTDQYLTSWDKTDTEVKQRLYYLLPKDSNSFQIRTFHTNVWAQKIKDELNSKWYETVEMERILPQSKDDLQNGSVRVLVSIGFISKRKLFIYRFNVRDSDHGVVLPQIVLQADSVDPLLTVGDSGLAVDGEVFFNIYDRSRSRLVSTKNFEQNSDLVYRHESESDVIAGHLYSFELESEIVSIIQTREELISIKKGAEVTISTRPKLRYSFLSQRLLSELYLPVTYNREDEILPALYVDSTSVTGNRVYLFEVSGEKLVSSIQNSLFVPSLCKALSPQFSNESRSHQFIFLCLENNSWLIRTFDMN